jgi:hypothetical protein
MNTIESAKRAVAVIDKGEATGARWVVSAAYRDAADACIAAIRSLEVVGFQYRFRMYTDDPWGSWTYPTLPIESYQNSGNYQTRPLYAPADAGGVKDSRDLSEAIGPEDGFEGLGFEKACE